MHVYGIRSWIVKSDTTVDQNRKWLQTPDTSPVAPPPPRRKAHLSGTKAAGRTSAPRPPARIAFPPLSSDLLTMEELFLSSAKGDSSLALPAEPARRSAAKVAPKDRSIRVQQQVQLTMARRARISAANGKVCF